MEADSMRNKFEGCLIGGAIGDALGYTVEFMNIGEIKKRFGNEGISDLVHDNKNGKALISDDTQMTLFIAEGLLWADYRGRHKGISSYEGCVFYAYQRWLYTQTGRLATEEYNWILDNEKLDYKSDLLSVKELFNRRAPGNTCITALSGSVNQTFGVIGRPINNSKGCGGVMRVAPVGLYLYNSPEHAFRVAADCAAITHGHPSGYLSAGVLAALIANIISGKGIRLAAVASMDILKNNKGHEECLEILNKALQLIDTGIDPYEAVCQLGQGWVGEEALAIALYCALKYTDDFKKALCLAVNHSGDSDSTGAICGNILGAYLGINSVPDKWVQDVEISDVIIKMAKKLTVVAKRKNMMPLTQFGRDFLTELIKHEQKLGVATFGLFIKSDNIHNLVIRTQNGLVDCAYEGFPSQRAREVLSELKEQGFIDYSENMHFLIELTELGRDFANEFLIVK